MPSFTNQPPEDPRGVALRLVRCPPIGTFSGVITSPDLIGTATHFWHGRTVPHEEEDCKACLDGLPWRWHAWVSVLKATTREHLLFEMTAAASKPLTTFRDANGSLRGCCIIASRPSRRPNGRVIITTDTMDLTNVQMPKEPNLVKALAIIWNIAIVDVDVAGLLRNMPRVKINDRNSEVFNPDMVDRRSNGHAKK